MQRRFMLAASTAALLPVLASCGASPSLPGAGQARSVSPNSAPAVEDIQWTDAFRGRVLPLRIRWPADDLTRAAVVLYSHGLGGSREGGYLWGDAWAKAGFMVVHLQHPGSDAAALRADLHGAMAPRQLVARLGDVRFVLDEMRRRQAAGEAPWQRADLSRVGLGGHSFGAHTVMGMAGQNYPGLAGVAEPRLNAFLALSPAAPVTGAAAAYSSIHQPMLCITGTLDGDVVGNGATPERRRAVFEALPAGDKAQLVLDGADHMSFAGLEGRALEIVRRQEVSRQKQPRHHERVAAISTDWWLAHLRGQVDARQRLQSPSGLTAGDIWQTK